MSFRAARHSFLAFLRHPLICFALVLAGSGYTALAQPAHYQFTQGLWFDGQTFEPKTFYTVDGLLTEHRPTRVDSVIDLQRRYVVPAFGEAHAHTLSNPETLSDEIQMYLADGVYYVMNQDPILELTPAVLDQVNRPTSVDVAYTQGVVAPSWSIIAHLYASLAEQGQYGPNTTLDDLDTRTIFLVDTENDLDAKWDKLAAQNEHFIKIILAFSEEQEERKNNPVYGYELGRYAQTPGIEPRLLPKVIERAHRAGLRASVHIETAADFRRAVEAGADLIAHLPASWQIGEAAGFTDGTLDPWLLDAEDARRAAERDVVVITTAFTPPDDPQYDQFVAVHRHNLALLAEHGVTLALGTDRFDATAQVEARYLDDLGVFDPLMLLNLLSQTTPQVIFPDRTIGALAEGYEASFLVLEDDPLNDFSAISRIALRVKQGRLLDLHP